MDTPVCTTDINGTIRYTLNGELHRIDGPAIIYSDGPAVIRPDGTEEYWLDDKQVDIMVHFLQRK